jgi:hypothetical protein
MGASEWSRGKPPNALRAKGIEKEEEEEEDVFLAFNVIRIPMCKPYFKKLFSSLHFLLNK